MYLDVYNIYDYNANLKSTDAPITINIHIPFSKYVRAM